VCFPGGSRRRVASCCPKGQTYVADGCALGAPLDTDPRDFSVSEWTGCYLTSRSSPDLCAGSAVTCGWTEAASRHRHWPGSLRCKGRPGIARLRRTSAGWSWTTSLPSVVSCNGVGLAHVRAPVAAHALGRRTIGTRVTRRCSATVRLVGHLSPTRLPAPTRLRTRGRPQVPIRRGPRAPVLALGAAAGPARRRRCARHRRRWPIPPARPGRRPSTGRRPSRRVPRP